MYYLNNVKFVYVYYAILLALVLFNNSEAIPNAIIRLSFLVVFFLPLMTKYKDLYPACLTCFMIVSTYGFAYGFFPYEMKLYSLLSFLVVLFSGKLKSIVKGRNYLLMFYILFHLLIVDLVNSGEIQNILYSILTILMFGIMIDKNYEKNSFYMMNAFALASLSLSLLFFFNYERFLVSYNALDGIERSGWADQNYLSCILGMGLVTSTVLLLTKKNTALEFKAVWIFSVGLSFMAQIVMASRGGVLASVIAVAVILLSKNIGKKYKILAAILLVIFILVLYDLNYFSLLEYRIENDATGGSGRIEIWEGKLVSFFEKANVFQWLFGMGFEGGMKLNGYYLGFHNDYLAFFCCYGFIGLFIFLYLLYYPIRVASKGYKSLAFALVLYLATICLTLEPLNAGRLPYFSYYFFVYIYALSTKQKYVY